MRPIRNIATPTALGRYFAGVPRRDSIISPILLIFVLIISILSVVAVVTNRIPR